VMYSTWWFIVCVSCNEQHSVHNRVTACVAVGGGTFENQL